jgi:hypothetical protein
MNSRSMIIAAALMLTGLAAQATPTTSIEYFTCNRPGAVSFRIIPAHKTITHTSGTVGGHPMTGQYVDVTSFKTLDCRGCVEATGEFFDAGDVVQMRLKTRETTSGLVADFVFRTGDGPSAQNKFETVSCY